MTEAGTLEAGMSTDFMVLDAKPTGRHHQHAPDLVSDSPRRTGGPYAANPLSPFDPNPIWESGVHASMRLMGRSVCGCFFAQHGAE
jgi:hypothetical protein